MPFVSHVLAIGLVTAAVLYSTLKLTKWSLNADKPNVRGGHVEHVAELYRMFLLTVVVVTFGSGIGAWLYDAWHWITGFL